MQRFTAPLALGLSLILTASSARAAPPAGPSATKQRAAQQRALELFDRSAEQYRAGHFDEAAKLLGEAYSLRPEPIILYNLAKALEGKGDVEGALDAYRRYLSQAKALSDRKMIEGRISAMEAQLAERARLSAKAEEESKRAAEEKRRAEAAQAQAELDMRSQAVAAAAARRAEIERERNHRARQREIAALSLAGFGVATVIAGAVLDSRAFAGRDTALSAPSALATSNDLGSARHLQLGANICLGVGGVLAGIGATWALVELVHSRKRRATEWVSR